MLEAWRERQPRVDGNEYLFLDEGSSSFEIGNPKKHQVDFANRRIALNGFRPCP